MTPEKLAIVCAILQNFSNIIVIDNEEIQTKCKEEGFDINKATLQQRVTFGQKLISARINDLADEILRCN